VERLVHEAHAVEASTKEALAGARDAHHALARRSIHVQTPDGIVLYALPLTTDDAPLLANLLRAHDLPSVSDMDRLVLTHLTVDVPPAVAASRKLVGVRRFFTSKEVQRSGEATAAYIKDFDSWAQREQVDARLQRLRPPTLSGRAESPAAALARVDITTLAPQLGKSSLTLGHGRIAELKEAARAVAGLSRRDQELRSAVVSAGEAVRKSETDAFVKTVPVDRLRDVTNARVRIGAVANAGLTTVHEVIEYRGLLRTIPGVGEVTAAHIEGAARTIWQTTFDEMPVRIDIAKRPSQTTQLLRAVQRWMASRAAMGNTRLLEVHGALSGVVKAVDGGADVLVGLSTGESAQPFADLVAELVDGSRSIKGGTTSNATTDPWDDFLARPSEYYAALNELGLLTEDEAKSEGDLPADIVEAVRALSLDTRFFSGSLRGYQSFGARFALVQKKVIIGDEMGLGKTIEALAVLTHLRAKGSQHFLVVCPAAVVTNWLREVRSKTQLPGHRLHGPARGEALRAWGRRGGVAVTTFETMRWLDEQSEFTNHHVEAVIVDEAHYIKNPVAKRSVRASAKIGAAKHAVLLTGTPMENRLEEFQTLVKYVRPDLVVDSYEVVPGRFRRQVAPAYLRRNQEDVLTELPELVEVDEWLPMSSVDHREYVDAVRSGSFMAMRQAAMLSKGSEKLSRLVELVAEAEESGRRVIVFSYFRQVLDRIARELPGPVFGPLTGSVTPVRRQQMVDEFSAARGGAVLIAQIEAGGVGLNIQAASTVIICEPQLKPTTEWQAIARARRMGQLEVVQVHRLLSEEGVDQRVTEILARKAGLFEEFARVSETAGIAPEAFDISEAELAKQIVEEERVRVLGGKVSAHTSTAEPASP
jgi:superfamily II DNA or RNA helicase